MLSEVLRRSYPPGHECVVYEASLVPVCGPTIERTTLEELPRSAAVCTASTLYVPPAVDAPIDPEMARRIQGR